MEGKRYFISEVSKMVGVEPHVLRYWEEELKLQIPRNSQGKRWYSQEDVELFKRVRFWKDKGMQLKAVKELLEEADPVSLGKMSFIAVHKVDYAANAKVPEDLKAPEILDASEKSEVPEMSDALKKSEAPEISDASEKSEVPETPDASEKSEVPETLESVSPDSSDLPEAPDYSIISLEDPPDSMLKFEKLLDGLIERALEKNNEKLIRELCDTILVEMEERMEIKLEEAMQRELLQEMLREGERESAAAGQKKRESLWQRWKRWLERI